MKPKITLLFLVVCLSLQNARSQTSFSADVINGCVPLSVNFTNTSSHPAGTYYQWNFGQGPWESSYHASHTFMGTGNYNIILEAYDTTGGGMNLLGSYNLPGGISANGSQLYLTSDTICPNELFEIYLYPYGNNTSWNFGDGNNSNQNQPQHSYPNTGTYTVTVTSNTSCGVQTINQDIVVMNNAIPNADFNSSSAICPNDPLTFYPQNYIATDYQWDFGDGNNSTEKQPTHSWATAGTYPVTLTLTSECGTSDSQTYNVEVENDLYIGNWVQIQFSSDNVCPGDLIQFDYNMNEMTTILWNFDDGNTSSDKNTSHSFSSSGTYDVSLYLQNGCGNDTTIYHTITVSNGLPFSGTPQMQFGPNPVCPGDNVYFNSSPANSYSWNFGDSNTSTDAQPVHAYTGIGNYIVELTLTNGCGNSAMVTDTINVNNSVFPQLSHSGNNSNWGLPNLDICPGDTAVFFAMGGTSYLWEFGDGNSTTETNPITIVDGTNTFTVDIAQHAFATSGTYEVKLTMYNSCGNSATDSILVNIGGSQPANADFVMTSENPMACAELDFLTFGGSEYIWDFGDGNSDTTLSGNISHTFSQAGTYSVSLTTMNGCGNTDSVTQNISVGGMTASASNISDALCFNSPTGEAEINASGGSAPYSYSVDGGTTQSSNSLSGLMPGNHTVEITDDNGCTINFPLIISSPSAIDINVSTTTSSCGNSDGTATANVTGGTGAYSYFWSTGGTGITENNLAAGSYLISVMDINSCIMTEIFSINDLGGPVVLLDTVFSDMCMEENSFLITGGTPAGGTYSGQGVNSGFFNPSDAGAGIHTIIYTFTQTGCTSSSSQTITVFETPTVNFSSTLEDICINATALNLSGGFPSGGTYSGTGVSGGNFNPATAGAGTHQITYTFIDGNGCTASDVNQIEVIEVEFNTTFSDVCIDAAPLALSGGSPIGGIYSGNGVSAGSFDPASAGSGNTTITYTFTSGNCTASAIQNIVVNDLPIVSFDTIIPMTCIYDGDFSLTGATPSGGTFSGTGVSGNVFSPSAAGTGTFQIIYTYNDGDCENSDTVSIVVDDCLGMEEHNDFSVSVYPNPFTYNTTITISEIDQNYILNITDLSGKIIREIILKDKTTVIEKENMSAGLYFYSVKNSSGMVSSGKMIVE